MKMGTMASEMPNGREHLKRLNPSKLPGLGVNGLSRKREGPGKGKNRGGKHATKKGKKVIMSLRGFQDLAKAALARSAREFDEKPWKPPSLLKPQVLVLQSALEAYVLKVANDACYKARMQKHTRVSEHDWFSAESRGYPGAEEEAVRTLLSRKQLCLSDEDMWKELSHRVDEPGLRRLCRCGNSVQLAAEALAAAKCMLIERAVAVLRGALIYVENGAPRKRHRISEEHLLEAIRAPIPEGLAAKTFPYEHHGA